MNDRLFQAGAILGGAAIIGTAMAVNPATADDLHRLMKLNSVKICTSSNPCAGGINHGTGPGVFGNNTSTGNGVFASAANNDGIDGQTFNQSRYFRGRAGVYGNDASTDYDIYNDGVTGSSTNGAGVLGSSTYGAGVYASGSSVLASGTNNATALVAGNTTENPTVDLTGGTSNDGSTQNLVVTTQFTSLLPS